MTDTLPDPSAPVTPAPAPPPQAGVAHTAAGPGKRRSGAARRTGGTPPRSPHPVLEQLAALYPGLFGKVFLPLKRGIFQDLLHAHPETLTRDTLKVALALHTRSTRYLMSVAGGLPRHDLQGLAVEAMAPEHVHQALTEVFRRRQARTGTDLAPELRARIAEAFEASGLSKEDYATRVRGKDDAANAVVDEALAEAATRMAKDDALHRAFEISGLDAAGFAGMYGLSPEAVLQSVARVRRRKAASAALVAPPDAP